MKQLAKKPSHLLAEKTHEGTIAEISPDDLVIVQKRQDWRVRVAQVCLDFFSARPAAVLATANRNETQVEQLKESLDRICDYIRRDLPVLLVTGVTPHDLEALRFKVNYYLEEIVRHIRTNVQKQSKSGSPLQDLNDSRVREEVFAALDKAPDSITVFIEDLIRLAQFEIEVNAQRERIRLLLGGDRRLSSFGNNEVIMTSQVDDLWRMINDFLGVCSYLQENLPPLLDRQSPYNSLEEELQTANLQLQMLTDERVRPFEERCHFKRGQDQVLAAVDEKLIQASQSVNEILDSRLEPMLRQVRTGRAKLITARTLKNLRDEVVTLQERLVKLPSVVFLPEPPKPELVRGEQPTLDVEGLNRSLEAVLSQMLRIRRTALWELGEDPAVPDEEALTSLLHETETRLQETREVLQGTSIEAHALRADKLKSLREHFCALMGELRTFLQTSFAHIAAKDPRSTESSYHFFLREFSDEARQAMVLLTEIRELEAFINNLQSFNIAGLPLNPENLARILRVLFMDKADEKKRIPSGEGWRIMSSFLSKLKEDLVPRLQKVCSLDGIRYEDKNFLTDWAMDLSENANLCLAQHEIGYSLLQEMGRLRDEGEGTLSQTYLHIVTTKTCREMQDSLTEVCMTLTASIPYVGIMREGIERRASVFFHRQQKILEGENDEAQAPQVMLPEELKEFGDDTLATIERAQLDVDAS